jgi:hypothetical protein
MMVVMTPSKPPSLAWKERERDLLKKTLIAMVIMLSFVKS